MKIRLIIALIFIFTAADIYTCNSCGGGTSDLAVLSLDGIALMNLSFTFDKYTGVWDQNGKWRTNEFSQSQFKTLISSAYRISRHLQFAVSLPFINNRSNLPGLKQSGSGIGDLTLGGRYEFTHEFQPKKKGKKLLLDNKLPYTALTFGLTVPTGKSEETAINDVDITGKGFFTSSLGISVTKSIIKSKLQVSGDFSWQHSFDKNFKSLFGVPLTSDYVKQPGDKFNYSVSINYIFNSWHAVMLTASGFARNNYSINEVPGKNSEESSAGLILSYTYYPSVPFRITSSVKLGIPSDGLGRNAQGSNTFNINFTYYFSDLNIK